MLEKFLKLKTKKHSNKGFTLIELLVVVAIVGMISSVVISSLGAAREKARDVRRLVDIKQIQNALDLYYSDYGRYPSATGESVCGGWDTTGDGVFLSSLISGGYLKANIFDPHFNTGCSGYYYYRYGASYGFSSPFYVLGIRNLERITSGKHPSNPGWFGVGRDWSSEFEWVTGKLE